MRKQAPAGFVTDPSEEVVFADEAPAAGAAADAPAAPAPLADAPLVRGPDLPPATTPTSPWKVLVVDDEEEVHQVTALALSDFLFDQRPLELLSANSARQARALLANHPDVALILLDVVMEEEDAGLKLAEHVRHQLNNGVVRIVLRTGQPGQAPEREVLHRYDINDYKSKSELTAQKLYSTVLTSLRSYRDIRTIDATRRGLDRILEAATSLFELQGLSHFTREVVEQLQNLLTRQGNALFCRHLSAAETTDGVPRWEVLAGAAWGTEAAAAGTSPGAPKSLPAEVIAHLEATTASRGPHFAGEKFGAYYRGQGTFRGALFFQGQRPFNQVDQHLLRMFSANVAVALDNINLYEQFIRAQEAAITSLADLAEYKDTETGEHLKRVENLSSRIAAQLLAWGRFPEQVTPAFVQEIRLASVLHDVGKVGIPESILMKPCKLDPAEWDVMKRHSRIGGDILERAARSISGRNYLSLAAEIARNHHEKYDGSGYPDGLSGAQIPLAARIVSVVDVYDALTSKRPYKEPWPPEQAIELVQSESGRHFDPQVVEAFLAVVATLKPSSPN